MTDAVTAPTGFVEGGRARLAYEERAGAPPALLCVHGNSSHRGIWRPLLAELAGWAAVAMDLRGHGDSGWVDPPDYGTETYAADIGLVAAALGLGGEGRPYALLAHSAGALASIAFVARTERPPRALVLFDAEALVPRWQVEYFRERAAAQGRVFASPEQVARGFQNIYPSTPFERLLPFAEEGMLPAEGGWRQKLDPATFATWEPGDLRPLLARIPCPTLVVRGGDSPVMSPAGFAALVAGIPGASGVEIPGTSHMLLLERPAEIAVAVRQLLLQIVL